MCFASIFSPSVTYPFILLRVILKDQILIFMKFNLSIFSFTDYDFNIVSQKLVPNSWPERFFSRSFIVLGFIFKYNIHFELVLVWCEVWRCGFKFLSSDVGIQLILDWLKATVLVICWPCNKLHQCSGLKHKKTAVF